MPIMPYAHKALCFQREQNYFLYTRDETIPYCKSVVFVFGGESRMRGWLGSLVPKVN